MPPEKRDSDTSSSQSLRLVKGRAAESDVIDSLVSGSMAQVVIAVAAVLAISYIGKLPLITLFLAILIAFVLAPVAGLLERWHSPRWASSFVAVFLLLAGLYAAAYFSYNKAMAFVQDLPKYSQKISQSTLRFRQQAEKIQESTKAAFPSPNPSDSRALPVKQEDDLSSWLMNSFGNISEVALSFAFIPFLTYFMLTWRERARDKTVKLFDPQNQHKVYVTLGGIAEMLKAFLVGNLVCGLFMAAISTAVFGFLRLPYFYFLGLISGFLSLLPYLGVVLAIMPPIFTGLGQLSGAQMVGIVIMVIGLHVFAINVLFPKFIGARLKLNPLVVTIALLIWGWIWGAVGLVLAIPITGALKIIFDHVESLRPIGAWMEP